MSKKAVVRTTEPIALSGDYDGFSVTLRTNVPVIVFADISSNQFDRIIKGLSEAIWEWDFYDEDGEPLPSLQEARAKRKTQADGSDPVVQLIGRIPFDAIIMIVKLFTEEVAKLNPQ